MSDFLWPLISRHIINLASLPPSKLVTSFIESQSHLVMSMNKEIIGPIHQHQHQHQQFCTVWNVNLGFAFTFSGIQIRRPQPKLFLQLNCFSFYQHPDTNCNTICIIRRYPITYAMYNVNNLWVQLKLRLFWLKLTFCL